MFRNFKWFGLVLMLLILSSCYTRFFTRDLLYKKEKNQLRVVTYNVNWGEKEFPVTAPQETTNAIKLLDGDIVLLQEATSFWQTYFKEHLTNIYPYQSFKSQGDAGGLAVLSKYPFTTQEYTQSAIGWHPGWIIDVDSPYGMLQVADLHLTPPLVSKANLNFGLGAYFSSPGIREKEIDYYYQFLRRNVPTIIAGDFNEEDHGFVTQFLNQHGFVDAQFKHGRHEFTWHWKIGFITIHRKLDHIFYNHWFKETRTQVYHGGDSDHDPLAVDLTRLS